MLFSYNPKRILFSTVFKHVQCCSCLAAQKTQSRAVCGDLCVSFQMKPMPGGQRMAQAICQLGAGRARVDSRALPSGWRCLATGPMTSECPRVPWGKQAHSEG